VPRLNHPPCHGRRYLDFSGCFGQRACPRLDGARLVASWRHGKHLLLGLQPPGWLTLHFGMNGLLRHFAEGESDPPYDRVRFDFADGHHLAYVNPRLFGGVGLATDVDAFITEEGLGPGALDALFDFTAFERALAGRKRDVKSHLMDQAVIAGIGNIYSDEILFQARIYPRTRADRLTINAKRDSFSCIKEVLQTAVDAEAGTERLVDQLPKTFFIPYRQNAARCPRYGGEVEAVKFSGRTAYYCPRCQPDPGQ
jgi:formamidopyrimidine-DNA glycosylase